MIRPLLAVAIIAVYILFPPRCGADPYDPSPPYQIGQNGALPGNQPFQPHCAVVPISCGFSFNPDHGTWDQKSNS